MIYPTWHILMRLILVGLILVAPTANAQTAAENVYENVKDSIGTIFSIDEENEEKSALGSGVAVEKSLIATNCHVALAGNFLIVKINNETLLGRLFYHNKKRDLCLIQIAGSPLKVVNIRPSKSVKIGEDVFAIGNPEGNIKTISRGIISNKQKENGIELLQTDASISHGSSGGGLFDVNGNLIGITTKAIKDAENIAFAIPTELILSIINTKEETNTSTTEKSISQASDVLPNNEAAAIPKPSNDKNYNKLIRLGYYGEDEIALLKWRDRCFIGIVGRYNEKPTSIAIWFPNAPGGLIIFSRVVNAESSVKFLAMLNESKNVDYPESKSFIYFDKKLYPLPIISINKVKQPVYVFILSQEITEDLIALDYFLGQFYKHTHSSGMTTVKFGLSGFTEAFGDYNKKCK